MDKDRAPASESQDTATADVRDAISTLRLALDRLESTLDSASVVSQHRANDSTTEAQDMPQPAVVSELESTTEPVAPAAEAARLPAAETPADTVAEVVSPPPAWSEPPPLAEPKVSGWAEEGQRESGWSGWTSPASLREYAGWPSPPQANQAASSQATEVPPTEPAATGRAEAGAQEEDVRDQVRRAVQQLKAEIESGAAEAEAEPVESVPTSPVTPFALEEEPEFLAQPAAELPAAEAQEDGEDVREQVRRAVMAARAEMEVGQPAAEGGYDTPAAAPGTLAMPAHSDLLEKNFLTAASLVIEDPEGRVELVRVYRTLARLECAATANLANYSSHSVTVQMEEHNLPSEEDIADAINYAFDRDCAIDVDGNRASIRLATSGTRAA